MPRTTRFVQVPLPASVRIHEITSGACQSWRIRSLGSGSSVHLEAPLHQIVLGNAAPARPCPGPGHTPGTRRHCAGKHCIDVRSGMLMLWWAPGSLLTVADILESYEGIRELSDGYLLPLVIHLQGMVGITANARTAILECDLTSRVAFVGTGPVDQVIAAFVEQSLSESRYFESPAKAEAWAREARSGD